MIEQKGPGLPQAACRRLSSSIYLQACAPALPPVWQACPGASSLPSFFQSPPFFSPLPLCLSALAFLISACLPSLPLGSFTPILCLCYCCVHLSLCMAENNAGSRLYMDPFEKTVSQHGVDSPKDRTRRAWQNCYRSGFFSFFLSSRLCVLIS